MPQKTTFVVELLFLLVAVLCISLALTGSSDVLSVSHGRLFTIWFVSALIYFAAKMRYVVSVFSPASLAVLYLGLSYSLGAAQAVHGHVSVFLFWRYGEISTLPIVNGYLMIVLTVLAFIAGHSATKVNEVFPTLEDQKKPAVKSHVLLALLCFFALTLVQSPFMFGFRFGMLMVAIYFATDLSRPLRYGVYLIALMGILSVSFENKREIIMCLIFIGIVETSRFKIPLLLNLKTVLLGFLGLSAAFVLIIVASIARGYGQYDIGSAIEGVLYISAYVGSDFFWAAFLENIEVTHTYPASAVAVDLMIKGDLTPRFGSTIIKPLFLPFPRDIVTFKPISSLQYFTEFIDPIFATKGGSLLVPIPIELVINFHFAGLLALIVLFVVLERVYLLAISAHSRPLSFKIFVALSTVGLSFILTRGGGADLYILTIGFSSLAYGLVRGVRAVSGTAYLAKTVENS